MSRALGVEEAVARARRAHAGQIGKAGRPHIEHPLCIMSRVCGEHEQIAAVLHDVLEDTPTTEDDLRAAGCPEPAIAAVRALTRQPAEPANGSMARTAANPIACPVKRAHIADNNGPARLALIDGATAQRLGDKYADSAGLLDRYAHAMPGRTDGR
jgi:hypothetical protein